MHRLLVVVLAACTGGSGAPSTQTTLPEDPALPVDTAAPASTAPSALTLHCASEVVDRVALDLSVRLDTGVGTLRRASPFVHGSGNGPLPEELWRGVATVEPSDGVWEVSFPLGDVDLPTVDGFGAGVVFDSDGEVEVTCWADTLPPRIGIEALPDAPSTLAEGCPEPLNELPWPYVRATRTARCTRLEGALNGDDLYYPILAYADLRGADLNDATLLFASLAEAQLEGTQLRDLEYGYAVVSGRIDDDTELPVEGCVATDDAVRCSR